MYVYRYSIRRTDQVASASTSGGSLSPGCDGAGEPCGPMYPGMRLKIPVYLEPTSFQHHGLLLEVSYFRGPGR